MTGFSIYITGKTKSSSVSNTFSYNDSVTSLSYFLWVSLSSCKAQDSFCATPLFSSQYHQDYSQMIPALSGTFKSSLQFLPYTFKHVQFSALLENVLLTQLPSLAAAIYFFPFTVKLFNFQISSLYLLPPFFPLTYPGIRLLFLLLYKKEFPILIQSLLWPIYVRWWSHLISLSLFFPAISRAWPFLLPVPNPESFLPIQNPHCTMMMPLCLQY